MTFLALRTFRARMRDTWIHDFRLRLRARGDLAAWHRNGAPIPPPHAFKQHVIRHAARSFGLNTLVETGTMHGDMVAAMLRPFATVYSIELDPVFCERARKRFARFPHVYIVQGDSSVTLPTILGKLREPALFWLDGHYSGPGTAGSDDPSPLIGELNHILAHGDAAHVIVIDDMRELTGAGGYPSQIEVMRLFGQRRCEVCSDLLVTAPTGTTAPLFPAT
jgi:hypothetical protein